jgi:hypothetical protein
MSHMSGFNRAATVMWGGLTAGKTGWPEPQDFEKPDMSFDLSCDRVFVAGQGQQI